MCRLCNNLARWDDFAVYRSKDDIESFEAYDQFCAEHQHAIPSFETVNKSLACPTQFRPVFEYKVLNAPRLTKQALVTAGGAAILGPFAYFAAPAIGGAIGAASGLSGAAATSAGLAAMGGGSLAAGGLGMAGGVMVSAALGTVIGGAMGHGVAAAYYTDLKGFSIDLVRRGAEELRHLPSVVTVDGLFSQGGSPEVEWGKAVAEHFAGRRWYHVAWEAGSLGNMSKGMGKELAKHLAARGMARAAFPATAPLALIDSARKLFANPWHVAMVKSEQTGFVLAEILRRCSGQQFTVLGHSLGCRVLGTAMRALAGGSVQCISGAHLLGGAIDNSRRFWTDAAGCLQAGTSIHNYHSRADRVLRYLYPMGTAGQSKPIGAKPINSEQVRNHDWTDMAIDHTDFKAQFAKKDAAGTADH